MRRWLTLRALGLGALALALIAGMAALGGWQFGAYAKHQDDSARSRLSQPPVPLDDLLGPDAAFPSAGVGRPVVVTGTYDAADQFYVRELPGARAAYAVVSPLTTPAGSSILIVRGSSSTPHAVTPGGRVTVRGVLQPSQPNGSPLDANRITDGLRIASLLASVPRDLYAGYIVLVSARPAETLPVVRAPLPSSSRWAGIRNLLYAFQWWVFAVFVAFMWWRVVGADDAPEPARNPVIYGQPP